MWKLVEENKNWLDSERRCALCPEDEDTLKHLVEEPEAIPKKITIEVILPEK